MQKISIIVPCFNEELVLPQFFQRLSAAATSWKVSYEVICIDDGSDDGTWELLKSQYERDPRWRCLVLARNFGHQAALSAGLLYSKGDAVIVMDADLQDPPEELPRLLEKWYEGYNVVYAIREQRKENFLKRIGYWAFYRLMTALVPFEIPLDSGDFCLMDRRVVAILNSMPERNRFVRGLRAWIGLKQTGISYRRHRRAAGSTKYSFPKLIKLASDGIFSFSTVPLRLVSYLGILISTLAGIGVVFTFIQRIFAKSFERIGLAPVPGFATVVISILFLGGVQLLCIGIVGEYIGRIYDEVKRRPSTVVREALGIDISAASPEKSE